MLLLSVVVFLVFTTWIYNFLLKKSELDIKGSVLTI